MKRSLLFGIGIALLGLGVLFGDTTWDTLWRITGSGSRRNTVEFAITAPAVGSAASFLPGATNANSIGSTSLRVLKLWTGTIDAAGGVAMLVSTAPRTAVGVTSVYSTYSPPAGTLFYDSTDGVLCISSGTLQTSITVSTGTGPCPN